MDVVWQDSVGSLLDSSGTDPSSFASFASDGGGALWSSSGDSPVSSSQSLLWENGADSPSGNPIGALTADSASGTGTSILPVNWIADGTSGFVGGSPTLVTGLLWSGASNDTSSSLASNGDVGIGALDLGAASGASQWQQFVDQFASGSAMGFADAPHLLWMGTSSQPLLTTPVTEVPQAIQIAPSDSLPLPTLASISPAQLAWTQPSAATGLTADPSLADAAPIPIMSGVGAGVPSTSGVPIAGAGSHA